MTYDSITWPRQCCPRGRDGEPLQVGEVTYGEDGHAWLLCAVGPSYVFAHDPEGGQDKRLRPRWLTHEAPDSWERLEREAAKLDLKAWPGMPADTHADLVARCKKLAGVE